MKVELGYIRNAGPKQEALALKAVQGIERAINHPDFKKTLIERRWDALMFRKPGGDLRELTPEEAYEKLISGAELSGVEDGVITIKCKLKKRSDVGGWMPYDDHFETAYWMINREISRGSYYGLAANFIHEWCHIAGFWHYPNNSARYDMPYNTGSAVAEILKKLDNPNGLKKSFFSNDHQRFQCGAHVDRSVMNEIEIMQ